MKKWLNVAAIALAMVLGLHAMADDSTPAKPTRGKVTAVAPDSADSKITNITITPHAKKGETATDIVVKADATTTVTKDKAAATLADVTVGSYVSVTLGADNKVTAIDIRPPKKKPTT